MKDRGVKGLVVWVTGASGGVGKAVVEAFLNAGSQVVATDIRPSDVVPADSGLVCDTSDEVAVSRVIETCDRLGGIDVLVNCAGIMRRANILDLTPELWDQVFNANVKGAFLCSQAAARSMIVRERGGSIVNIGSVNAEKVFADSVAYCASKGALHSLTRTTALALAPHNIRVNAVAPGAIADTDLELERWQHEGERMAMARRTPMGRLGSSADVAPAVVFLASPEAAFITGTVFYVDGGRTASV